jgi:hypothetical protein
LGWKNERRQQNSKIQINSALGGALCIALFD